MLTNKISSSCSSYPHYKQNLIPFPKLKTMPTKEFRIDSRTSFGKEEKRDQEKRETTSEGQWGSQRASAPRE